VRRHLAILLATIAAVGGAAALALFKEPTLGLDLQGGLEIVYKAEPPEGSEITDEGMDNAVEIFRQRVDKLGVAEPEIRKQGEDQIAVELAGVHDPGRAAQIIGTTAQLAFYDLEANLVGPSISSDGVPQANTRLLPLLTKEDDLEGGADPTQWYLFSKKKERLAGPADSKAALATKLDGEVPEGAEYYAVPGNRIVLTCGPDAVVCPGDVPPTRTYYYLFRYQPSDPDEPVPELTGEDLKGDRTRQDFDQFGRPNVLLEFTDRGADRFHEITRELSRRGAENAALGGATSREEQQLYAQHFAIVLDGEIRSFPQIDFTDPSLADGISGGSAQITGLENIAEADALELVLQTGALPYDFVQLTRTDISATLGEDSLREALIAGIGGLIAVAAFLLLFYRFLGLVAIIGLGIYGIFLYATILLFNVTLSLPGFAGLILTIGVAADANIVIFERIKEEVRAGKSVRASIASGYRKGFSTIVDANVVTMITAFVLFAVATGGVKGFALMLLIGTLISMVTAVAATRALLGMLAGFRWFDNPAFMGASGQRIPAWQRIDFAGRRNWWFAFSGIVLLVGFGSLGIQGLNLGIDFKGGSQVNVETPQPVSVERVREEIAAVGRPNAVVQGRGELRGDGYTAFAIKTESLPAAAQTELQDALRSELDAESIGVRNVSASFSQQILRGAILAILVSLVLIVLYVTVRFELKFALPILVALLHDVLVTVGVYSLTDREVTTSTVAALLTILGYSIYDTIIIFDRVRENIPLMRRSSFAAIANQSLWETIRRSLATTFITLLPVASLLVFGGETLKDFAFAILVGVGSGAYSTIFIATPLLVILKEREPEYAKRKEAGLREKLEVHEDGRPAEPEPVEVEAPVEEAEPEPEPAAPAAGAGDGAAAAARREARRKRRRARPHGRAR
jgi:SecD/SecF fusion protein